MTKSRDFRLRHRCRRLYSYETGQNSSSGRMLKTGANNQTSRMALCYSPPECRYRGGGRLSIGEHAVEGVYQRLQTVWSVRRWGKMHLRLVPPIAVVPATSSPPAPQSLFPYIYRGHPDTQRRLAMSSCRSSAPLRWAPPGLNAARPSFCGEASCCNGGWKK